jgi:hypothetical protein
LAVNVQVSSARNNTAEFQVQHLPATATLSFPPIMSPVPSPAPLPPQNQASVSGRHKHKPFAVGIAAGAEDAKYQAKYKELKRKVKDIENVFLIFSFFHLTRVMYLILTGQ